MSDDVEVTVTVPDEPEPETTPEVTVINTAPPANDEPATHAVLELAAEAGEATATADNAIDAAAHAEAIAQEALEVAREAATEPEPVAVVEPEPESEPEPDIAPQREHPWHRPLW